MAYTGRSSHSYRRFQLGITVGEISRLVASVRTGKLVPASVRPHEVADRVATNTGMIALGVARWGIHN